MIFSLISTPLSLILYGVGIQNNLHWMYPTIGLALGQDFRGAEILHILDCFVGNMHVAETLVQASSPVCLSVTLSHPSSFLNEVITDPPMSSQFLNCTRNKCRVGIHYCKLTFGEPNTFYFGLVQVLGPSRNQKSRKGNY